MKKGMEPSFHNEAFIELRILRAFYAMTLFNAKATGAVAPNISSARTQIYCDKVEFTNRLIAGYIVRTGYRSAAPTSQ
jgi:hypothetical protein